MNTTDTIRAQSHKDPEQLEREIDHQRDHIASLIDALEGRLSPGELISKAVNSSKDNGRELATNLAQAVRDNPTAALLTAAGVAWLWTSQRHPPATHREPGELREGLSEKAHHARERLGSARERAGETAHGAADSVRRGARRANDGFHDMLENNPMALGAIGIAVGALVAGLLPPTDKEDELMGETRDRLADQAREAARHAREEASQAGREVTTPRTPDAAAGSDTANRYH